MLLPCKERRWVVLTTKTGRVELAWQIAAYNSEKSSTISFNNRKKKRRLRHRRRVWKRERLCCTEKKSHTAPCPDPLDSAAVVCRQTGPSTFLASVGSIGRKSPFIFLADPARGEKRSNHLNRSHVGKWQEFRSQSRILNKNVSIRTST